jgi:small-conductance mechanosensitive channel
MFKRSSDRKLLTSWLSIFLSALLIIAVFFVVIPGAYSDQGSTPSAETTTPKESLGKNQVILDGNTLFTIQSSRGGQTREDRAQEVTDLIQQVANNRSLGLESLTIKDKPPTKTTEILAGEKVLISISEADAKATDQSREQLAQQYLETIKEAIADYRQAHSPREIFLGLAKTAIATMALILLIRLLNRFVRLARRRLHNRYSPLIRTIRIGSREFLHADQIRSILSRSEEILRFLIILALISAYLNTVLSFFPQTRSISVGILASIFTVCGQLLQGVIGYIPKLIFLVILSYITFYLLKFVHFLFIEVEEGSLNLPGFEREWAIPTSRISQFLLLAFFGMIAFPYLPGAGSDAFQGISIFLGVLISLGSSSAITNIIAGILLTYTRAFRIGDKVEIDGTSGVVVDKGLLVTRLMTDQNHFVNIPNGNVLSTNVTNFRTDNTKEDNHGSPPIIILKVDMGYEVPWQKAYDILQNAAKEAQYVLTEPAPYVLHHDLQHFYVTYRLHVYTQNSGEDDLIRSQLRRAIQERCYQEGIQLISAEILRLANVYN